MKQALVILANGFEAVEGITMIDILRYTKCINVTTAGLDSEKIRSNLKINIIADTILDNIDASQFDALILPGGFPGVHHLIRNTNVGNMVHHFSQHNKYIVAVCAAPLVLSHLGILNNRRFTCHPSVIEEINKIDPSAHYQNQKVVSDTHVMTTQGPGTVMQLALLFIKTLCHDLDMEQFKRDIVV